jgi:hypothetical protein
MHFPFGECISSLQARREQGGQLSCPKARPLSQDFWAKPGSRLEVALGWHFFLGRALRRALIGRIRPTPSGAVVAARLAALGGTGEGARPHTNKPSCFLRFAFQGALQRLV